MELALILKPWIYNYDSKRIIKKWRIQKELKKLWRRWAKWQVECSLWKTRSTLVHEPVETKGLSDQESTGPRLRFVSISEIVQEESKDPELEENKDIFEDEGYDLSEEEEMTKAQKVDQKKVDKEKRYQRVEILHSLGYTTAQIAED